MCRTQKKRHWIWKKKITIHSMHTIVYIDISNTQEYDTTEQDPLKDSIITYHITQAVGLTAEIPAQMPEYNTMPEITPIMSLELQIGLICILLLSINIENLKKPTLISPTYQQLHALGFLMEARSSYGYFHWSDSGKLESYKL